MWLAAIGSALRQSEAAMNWEEEPVPHFWMQTRSVGLGTLPLFKRGKHSAKEEADCGAQGHIGYANGMVVADPTVTTGSTKLRPGWKSLANANRRSQPSSRNAYQDEKADMVG